LSSRFLVKKELEHRNWVWKVLILKYDLGKSLSKEMWCKMADTKENWLDLHILKDEKCMLYEVNPFCVRGQENDFPSYVMNDVLKMSWFVHIFLQT